MRIASVHPRATEQEIAAIATALAVVDEERRQAAAAAATSGRGQHLDAWVEASRRAAQRSGLQRGPWRISGRIVRRSRI